MKPNAKKRDQYWREDGQCVGKRAWNEKEADDGMVKLWSGEAGNRNKRKGEEGS